MANTKKRKVVRKRKAVTTALPASKKFGKKNYKQSACGMKKVDAKKKAETIRKGGKLARLVKNKSTGKYCVYTASSSTGIGKRRIRRRK